MLEVEPAGLDVTISISDDLSSYVFETGTCETTQVVGKAECTITIDAQNITSTETEGAKEVTVIVKDNSEGGQIE